MRIEATGTPLTPCGTSARPTTSRFRGAHGPAAATGHTHEVDSDDAASRLTSYLLDLRLLLRSPQVVGQRRRDIEHEVEVLRLARAGVRTKDSRHVLARAGITRPGRRRVVRRGPREWGERVTVHVR